MSHRELRLKTVLLALVITCALLSGGCPPEPFAMVVVENTSTDLHIIAIEVKGPNDTGFGPVEMAHDLLPGESQTVMLPIDGRCQFYQVRVTGSDTLPCDQIFAMPSRETMLTLFDACRGETYNWFWGESSCDVTIFDGLIGLS